MAADPTTANLTNGTNSFDIICLKIEHDYVKDLIILPIPQKEDKKNKSPLTGKKNPLVYNIDILQLKQVITLTGYLLEEEGNTDTPDTFKSALGKKDQLESMLSTAGKITLTWKINTQATQYTITKYGNIIKCKVSEVPMRIGDLHPDVRNTNSTYTQGKAFPILLQFGVGTHRG